MNEIGRVSDDDDIKSETNSHSFWVFIHLTVLLMSPMSIYVADLTFTLLVIKGLRPSTTNCFGNAKTHNMIACHKPDDES